MVISQADPVLKEVLGFKNLLTCLAETVHKTSFCGKKALGAPVFRMARRL